MMLRPSHGLGVLSCTLGAGTFPVTSRLGRLQSSQCMSYLGCGLINSFMGSGGGPGLVCVQRALVKTTLASSTADIGQEGPETP